MNGKTKKVTRSMLLVSMSLAFFLVAVVQTQAKPVTYSPQTRSGATGVLNRKARLIRVLERAARTNPKLAKALTKGCGCLGSSPQELGGWGNCFRNCLKDVGISPYALIMCGVACAMAETGVGALACAVCLGVSVTVVEWCAIGCAAYPGGKGYGIIEGRLRKPAEKLKSNQTARLTTSTLAAGT